MQNNIDCQIKQKSQSRLHVVNNKVKALLVKQIELTIDGVEIVFPVGSEIMVDTLRGLACLDNTYHTEVYEDEYHTLFLN